MKVKGEGQGASISYYPVRSFGVCADFITRNSMSLRSEKEICN